MYNHNRIKSAVRTPNLAVLVDFSGGPSEQNPKGQDPNDGHQEGCGSKDT
jgi:hypothetical protein